MSKAKDDIRPEYRREDLGPGVRGKYYKQVMAGGNFVVLRPEIHKAFPTSEAVNDALAALLDLTERTRSLTSKPKRPAKKRAAA